MKIELQNKLLQVFSESELFDLCRFKELDTMLIKGGGLNSVDYSEYEELEQVVKGEIFKSI